MMKTYEMKLGESREEYLKRAACVCRRIYLAERAESGEHWTHAMQKAMTRTETLFPDLGSLGVEGDTADNGDDHIDCLYLNMGDSYELTLLCGVDDEIQITTWGDYAESFTREADEETSTIICIYCGKRTPAPVDWRGRYCDHCHKNPYNGAIDPETGKNKEN